MSTTGIPVDVDVLRDEIQKTYGDVSTKPEEEFIFPTGRPWAEELDYPAELANVPDEDTRRKAEKFGAMGSTIRATKPRRN